MRSADTLSDKQQRILKFIQSFVRDNGYPPAIRQIQDALGISSTSVVAYNLKALEAKGALSRQDKVSRGIKLPETMPVPVQISPALQVPLLGTITAGGPLPDPEEVDIEGAELIDVPAYMLPGEDSDDVYALRVRGHSMIDALIDDGDTVLLRKAETAVNGEMVAAMIIDENAVTLKKFYSEGAQIRLQPANITMDPIYVRPDNLLVRGKVIGVLRKL